MWAIAWRTTSSGTCRTLTSSSAPSEPVPPPAHRARPLPGLFVLLSAQDGLSAVRHGARARARLGQPEPGIAVRLCPRAVLHHALRLLQPVRDGAAVRRAGGRLRRRRGAADARDA